MHLHPHCRLFYLQRSIHITTISIYLFLVSPTFHSPVSPESRHVISHFSSNPRLPVSIYVLNRPKNLLFNSLFLSKFFQILLFWISCIFFLWIQSTMGIKKTSGGQRSNKTSKSNKKKERKCPAVQVLYDTCKEVFENCGPGIIPSPENIQRLKDVMGTYVIMMSLCIL